MQKRGKRGISNPANGRDESFAFSLHSDFLLSSSATMKGESHGIGNPKPAGSPLSTPPCLQGPVLGRLSTEMVAADHSAYLGAFMLSTNKGTDGLLIGLSISSLRSTDAI